jgi:hypothetical protein
MTNPQLIELAELLARVSKITQKDFSDIVYALEDVDVLDGKDADNIIDLAAHRKLTP